MTKKEVPWFYIAVEFGRFGWGRSPEPILPVQFEIFIARVSFGPSSLSQGLLGAMQRAGLAGSVPATSWRRMRLRTAWDRFWMHVQWRLPFWFTAGFLSFVAFALFVELSIMLSLPQ